MVQIGDTLPDSPVFLATEAGPKAMTLKEYGSTGRLVLFGVPGAFTPTCSARHLPGFIERRAEFTEKGVDKLACLSVNDAFVMQAWAEKTGAVGKIDMIADGSALAVRALGLDLDATAHGMGVRSARFAMVVEEGRVTQLTIDPPGTFEISSAGHVLNNL